MHQLAVLIFMISLAWAACQSPGVKGISAPVLPCAELQNVVTIANCTSPLGKYTTEVHADTNDYVYFRQVFGQEQTFVAILTDEFGVAQDSSGAFTDTLPPPVIEMIRSHAFHLMALCPHHFYSDMAHSGKDTFFEQVCERFVGVDGLQNPVSLFYDGASNKVLGIDLLNPIDTAERIQVIHDTWRDSDNGPLIQTLRVVQAERDTFVFDFDLIEVNSPDFRRVQ